MGYLIVPDHTKESILCQSPCQHTDCAAMRQDFLENGTCKKCGKQLQPGDMFYYIEPGSTDKVCFGCALQ